MLIEQMKQQQRRKEQQDKTDKLSAMGGSTVPPTSTSTTSLLPPVQDIQVQPDVTHLIESYLGCSFCYQNFATEAALQQHVLLDHPDAEDQMQ